MLKLIKVGRENETATFEFTERMDYVPWSEMAEAIFEEVDDDKYFRNFFNLRWYYDDRVYAQYVVPEYTPFSNVLSYMRVADIYSRWEKKLENPFLQYVSVNRKYKAKTFLRSTKGDGNYDFKVVHSMPYKTATYDIAAGTYELSFEVIFGFASESAFPAKNWLYHTRFKMRWNRFGEQYDYPWQTFVPDEYKLPNWSYDDTMVSRIQKAKKLVANGNNIEYPLVDFLNYVAEVDPRELEYECYTDIHYNPYAIFHFWNKKVVWVGIPRELQKEEKIYVRFYMYNEIWALGKATLGGDPLTVHATVFTAEEYQKFLNGEESPKQRIPW